MTVLIDDIPRTALAVYAHPDDADISCGGTLARWSAAGCRILLVVCTNGDKGVPGYSGPPESIVARRKEEVAASSACLGIVQHEMLGYPDGELNNGFVLREQLVALVRRHKPQTVVFPDPTAVFFGDTYVNHHDHRELGWAMLDVIAPAASSALYFPEAGPAHATAQALLSGTLEPDAWVDIASSIEEKAEAVRCHASQLGTNLAAVDDLVRSRAMSEGRSAGIALAEGFRRLRLVG